jgi:hypothetical protein
MEEPLGATSLRERRRETPTEFTPASFECSARAPRQRPISPAFRDARFSEHPMTRDRTRGRVGAAIEAEVAW